MANNVQTTLTDKHINWLLTEAGLADSPEREKLVQLIEATASTTQRRRKPKAVDLVTNYAQQTDALTERLRVTQQVAASTLRKMKLEIPEDLYWAAAYRPSVTIIGIHQPNITSHYTKKTYDVTSVIASGKSVVTDETLVEVEFRSASSTKPGIRVLLPVSLLNNDPIAVAQHVRKRCKAYAAQQERETTQRLAKAQQELEQQLVKAKEAVANQQALIEKRRLKLAQVKQAVVDQQALVEKRQQRITRAKQRQPKPLALVAS